MAVVLGFDTAGPWVAAALVADGRLLAARAEPMERGQAERLVDLLAEMLAAERLDWPALDAVACGTGPGNFTGVRIAVAAARGLALALRVPALGVTRFEALALGQPEPCVVALDARRGEAYVQRFGDGAMGPELLAADQPLPLAGAASVIGDAPGLTAPAPERLAENIARVALSRLGTAQPRPAALYLRPADAAPPREPPPASLP